MGRKLIPILAAFFLIMFMQTALALGINPAVISYERPPFGWPSRMSTIITFPVGLTVDGNITSEYIIGNMSLCIGADCRSSWPVGGNITYEGGNTTAEILAVTNNSAQWTASVFTGNLACSYLTGNTSDLCTLIDTKGGNTTAEIIAVTNNTADWRAIWFYGQFNWTPADTWNIFDGNVLTFNESKLASIYYNASTIQVVTGTPAGTIGDIRTYDNIPYNISEVASDLELRVNFTEVDDFNNLIVRYKSNEEDEPHVLLVQIWNYDNDVWEEYDRLVAVGIYIIRTSGVYDAISHIEDGVVQVRFYQDEGVPAKTHLHNFDWVTLSKGFGVPSGEEEDPHSFHRDENINNIGFNITTDNIFADFGDLVSEQNPSGVNAIRLKGTGDDIDIVIGDMTGYFNIWNVADSSAIFYVNERGDTDIGGDLTVDGTVINTDFTTLTDNSMADALHRHSELSASDGTPDPALSVDAGGRVGINTAVISDQFTLDGAFRFREAGDLNNYGKMYAATDNVYIDSYGTAANTGGMIFRVKDASVTAMTMLASGDVGIGTTSPKTDFEVDGKLRSIGTGTTPSSLPGIEVFYNTDVGRGYVYAFNWTGVAYLPLRLGPSVNILPNGDVGIGITSPTSELTVNGDITIGTSEGGHYIYFYEDGSAIGEYILWDNGLDRFKISAPLYVDGSLISLSGTSTINAIQLLQYAYGSGGNLGVIIYDGLTVGLNDASGIIHFGGTSEDTNLFRDAPNVLRTSDSFIVDGSIGIGTVSPDTKLDVNGIVSADGYAGQPYGWVSLDDDSIVAATIILFGEGSAETIATDGIVWNATSSQFEVQVSGVYEAVVHGIVASAASGFFDLGIRVNDTIYHSAPFYLHSAVDPISSSTSWIGYLDDGDTIDAFLDGNPIVLNWDLGSTFTVKRIS